MTTQTQQDRAQYEFWHEVRGKLADGNLADPDTAIQRYMDFLREKEIPWDLVYHQGADEAARSILEAEQQSGT